jgi:hypothetical protein
MLHNDKLLALSYPPMSATQQAHVPLFLPNPDLPLNQGFSNKLECELAIFEHEEHQNNAKILPAALKAQADEHECIMSNQAAKGKCAKNICKAEKDMEGTAVVTPLPRVGIIQAGVCKAWDEEGEM